MINALIRKKIADAFKPLVFEEQRHLYFWHHRQIPRSVTALVEDHEYPFEEHVWLPRCAKKEGISEHELKHRWQTTNQEAAQLGTETHDFLEHFTGIETARTSQQRAGVKFLRDYLKDYEILFRELRMYSTRWGFAGTADLPLIHKNTGEIIIADYKTNKDLFKTYGILRPPFQYLESHPFAKYGLQLSYYQIMLEEIGVPVSKRLLVHLKADETYKTYEMYDFTKELIDYLYIKEKNKFHATW